MKTTKIASVLILCIILASCGDSEPKITHFVVKSDRTGILFDSDDTTKLSTLQKIFNSKQEEPDASPDFKFFIDITVAEKTDRWQYSLDGYIRNYTIGYGMIYKLDNTAEFNRTANIQ